MLRIVTLFAGLLLSGCVAGTSQQGTSGGIAITNVTVIDVTAGSHEMARLPGQTVIVRDGRIAAVGPSATTRVPGGPAIVDGAGGFLIPGLWDMHSHNEATGLGSLDLYLANGVVGTRDMGSATDFILPLRDRIARGELSGPTIIAAGPILDAAPAGWPFRRRTASREDARASVKDLHARGVDFIKVHDNTPREAFFAIAEESKRLGLRFAGHVPANVSIEEAASSGINSIEHFANGRVHQDCATKQPYSLASCRVRFQALAAKGVWQTPTLAFYNDVIPTALTGGALPSVEYASDGLLDLWRKNFQESRLSPEAVEPIRQMNQKNMAAIRELVASGSKFLAGCDAMVPGFCLHDELALFTKAGLTPLEALKTATINPAIFLGLEGTSGSIHVGKRADLVLLGADPLSDIKNSRRISAVVAAGRLLRRSALDEMLTRSRRNKP